MIYFDNGATSWPKPNRVYRGVYEYMKHHGANPGRSGHRMAIESSDMIYCCREFISSLVGLENPSDIIFTKNTTEALNIVIKGVLKAGDEAICTSMEHNSVYRPLDKMTHRGVKFHIVWGDENGVVSPSQIEEKINNNTKLIIVNHVSNVCGTIQDIDAIGEIARKKGVLFLVDGAQSGGVIKYNMKYIDFLCLAGHKGLYGPMGTGVLCINSSCNLSSLMEGGTGSYSSDFSQPLELPDYLESGTLNGVGIAGLLEGVKFVTVVGEDEILSHERALRKYFVEGLNSIPNTVVYGEKNSALTTGVVAFNRIDMDCVNLSAVLNDKYDIASRAGFHCAYPAHKTIGSINGAVRFSFGYFNTKEQVSKALFAIRHAK